MSILRRLFRRGPDARSVDALIEMLAQRGVLGRAAEQPDAVTRDFPLPRGARALAVIELHHAAAPLRHVVASQIGGDAAGHMGKITVTGIHVTAERSELPDQWPADWDTLILAQPQDQGSFAWRPLNATTPGCRQAVDLLSANDRIARLVNVLLSEPQTLHVEVAPTASRVRVAAHRSGAGLPQSTMVEAVLGIARTIAGIER